MLQIENLQVKINSGDDSTIAVRDISFNLGKGSTIGIVGESGCGKSMTALAIMGLLPENSLVRGKVIFNEKDLLSFNEQQYCQIRGNKIGMIFQEPMTSLNPLHRIGKQIAEPMILHRKVSRREAKNEVIKLLDMVGIPEPSKRIASFPHELSGGQRQRVMIAMALSCGPDILIADEPTTALDVTIQKQILDLINNLIEDLNMSMIFISHDLAVVKFVCDEVNVMNSGIFVEQGKTREIFSRPRHEYTQSLLKSVPRI